MNNKHILTEPVQQFIKNYPNAPVEQVKILTSLHQQYVELKKQHKHKLISCKKLSREIGIAKRDGQPTEQLILEMQDKSSDASNVMDDLKDISDSILGYFKPSFDFDVNKTQKAQLSTERTYTDHNANDILISELNNEFDAWNTFVESSPYTSIYHRAEWKELIFTTFGHESFFFFANNSSGEVLGILPLVRLRSRLFGDFVVSMPYFNYGGAIATSLSIEQKLIQTANAHAKKLGVHHIEYRDDVIRENLPSKTEKVNMILSLPASNEALWNNFTSKLRSQIKRSQLEETQVFIGTIELLNDFYTVFSRNMRDLGTPVYSKSFLKIY